MIGNITKIRLRSYICANSDVFLPSISSLNILAAARKWKSLNFKYFHQPCIPVLALIVHFIFCDVFNEWNADIELGGRYALGSGISLSQHYSHPHWHCCVCLWILCTDIYATSLDRWRTSGEGFGQCRYLTELVDYNVHPENVFDFLELVGGHPFEFSCWLVGVLCVERHRILA